MSICIFADIFFNFCICFFYDFFLFWWNNNIVHTKSCTVECCVFITAGFDCIEHLNCKPRTLIVEYIFNHLLELFIAHLFVDEIYFIRHRLVKRKSSSWSFNYITSRKFSRFERIFWSRNFNKSIPFNCTTFCSKTNFISRTEAFSCSLCTFFDWCHVINSKNHILRRRNNRFSVCRVKKVSCRKHQCPAFHLCSLCKRNMNCHLVTIEVSIESLTCKRMKF